MDTFPLWCSWCGKRAPKWSGSDDRPLCFDCTALDAENRTRQVDEQERAERADAPPAGPAIKERTENGQSALDAMEAHYGNGSPVDNITDLLCDLMHAGVAPGDVEACVIAATMHYRAECAEPDTSADDAADAADARAEGLIP